MPTMHQPTDDLVRELYARFGLAYYRSEVLHRGLCIVLATSDLPRRDLLTRPRVEEHLAHAFALTLGDVISRLDGKLPAKFSKRLEEVRQKRNFLAHHFWFDRAHLMFRVSDIQDLIDELNGYTETFTRMDRDTSAWFHARRQELGLSEDILQYSLTRILSGDGEQPLPSKHDVKKLEKKLKGKQRLIEGSVLTNDNEGTMKSAWNSATASVGSDGGQLGVTDGPRVAVQPSACPSRFRAFGVFRGCGDDISSKHAVESNGRPAAAPGVGNPFGSPFCARPDVPAAVADLRRWQMKSDLASK